MVQKICFVTIGATASFDELLQAVLSNAFFQALEALEYTHLLLQYGKNGKTLLEELDTSTAPGRKINRHGIEVNGFDFNSKGLGQEMWSTKAAQDRAEGVVISHAGIIPTLPPSRRIMLRVRPA